MPKGYRQLSQEERDRLAVLKAKGRSVREIARLLGRNPGTISRELKRYARSDADDVYLATVAQREADRRRQSACRHPRLRDRKIRSYVSRQIRRSWSPEQIAGRIKRIGLGRISHEAIYQWVYAEARQLIEFLPRKHTRRLPRGHRLHKQKVSFIPSRTPLSKRPKFIERRRQLGHWEADLVLGRHSKSAVQILVERSSRYTRLHRLPVRQAVAVRRVINRSLAQYPSHLRRTITYDNGRENVHHRTINETLGTKSYFCEPMHSWEKGTVENTAGLVRRFLPKKTDFAIVSPRRIKETERWLNGRPRKCLGFRTPAEAFRQGVALRG